MTDQDKPDGDDVQPGAEGQAQDAGPAEPELTVDDILNAVQTDDAALEDADAPDHDLLLDLKRLQAEYANYRRRTEEQREVEIDRAKGAVAKGLLPVLDDLDRAEKHGDLAEGSPFAAIAEKLRGVAERMGLVAYGVAGEVFDPQQHEAIFQQPTPGATRPRCWRSWSPAIGSARWNCAGEGRRSRPGGVGGTMASQDWFDKDFYQVLGVEKDVSAADLKKTYRKLARQYHPDSNQGDAAAEARFKEISEAYAVLSDPEQREEYDQIRAMGSGARFTAGRPGQGGFDDVFSQFGQGRGGRYTGSAQDFDDIFSMFSQGGGRFGSGSFGQTSGGYRGFGGPTRGADITARTTLDFTTAAQGDTISLQSEDGKPFKVKIPAGVADGQKIRLPGRGRPSPDGGESGDIVVQVSVRPHPVFTRDGLNLRVVVPVTFTEATLGATIEVPTLGGEPVRLRVAPGTPSGRVLRVKDAASSRRRDG